MMAAPLGLVWQASLLSASTSTSVRADASFRGLCRHELDATSWVDHVEGWVAGADELFAQLLERARWGQHRRRMYERDVDEPRLTASGIEDDRPLVPVLGAMRDALGVRYERSFESVHLALYRDGRDSVAWHSDRIARAVARPVIAVVGLGEPRRFHVRRKAGGGVVRRFALGSGDLVVMGGEMQTHFEHSVPKVARAGARMSIGFREPH